MTATVAERDTPARAASGRAAEGMAGLAKGLAVVEAFGPDRTRLTVTEAARLTGTAPAVARRCLLTLEELGYLSHDGKFFRPTPRMLRLGTAYLGAAELPALAEQHVAAARDELGESVSCAVLEGGWSVFVARAEVQRIVSTGVRLGARLPAHASATGRVLLAGLTDDEAEEHLRACEPRRTTVNTVTTLAGLRARVRLARTDGVAVTDEELELGMRSLAVPVVDSLGRTRAALSVSAFAARVSVEAMRRELAPALRRHADRLGRSL